MDYADWGPHENCDSTAQNNGLYFYQFL
jgi:hypothetical protein